MAKRAPSSLNSLRIELQSKERDLAEQWQYMQAFTSVINSLSQMKIETMYGWITILEAFGFDTKIPTISDADELIPAFTSWGKDKGDQIRKARDQGWRTGTGYHEAYNVPFFGPILRYNRWLLYQYDMYYAEKISSGDYVPMGHTDPQYPRDPPPQYYNSGPYQGWYGAYGGYTGPKYQPPDEN